MFLARDPALSVVEGVEFRFENIRSVGYHIAKKDRRDLIPTKPNTVNVKFRCHDAVLNTAGSTLYYMFDAFPNSKKTKVYFEDLGRACFTKLNLL